ncbi:MAG: AI-2E family transporter [Bacteroidia bacterium]|nr:AI-2E family transporter [Bacteroidia bacterium]
MDRWKQTLIISGAILTTAGVAALVLGGIGLLLVRFSALFIYLITALIFTLMGRPIKRFLDKLKVGKFSIPNMVSTILTLVVLLVISLGILAFFVPLVVDIADQVQDIDPSSVASGMEEPFNQLREFNAKYRLFELKEGESLEQLFLDNVQSIVEQVNISSLISGILGFAGNFFVGAFSIIFITFFFLNQKQLLPNIVHAITPEAIEEKVNNALESIKSLLSRYFIGVILEVLLVGGLVALGLGILGIKNALFIGYFAGVFNIIPYLGPIIGGSMTVAMTTINTLSLNFYEEAFPLIVLSLIVFVVVQLIDNFIIQPFIYSSSVKAHPLEIFLVIIGAGFIGGAAAMVLAIPVYTILRVVAREFFNKFKIVSSLTASIEEE